MNTIQDMEFNPILLRISLDICWRDNPEFVDDVIKYLSERTTSLFGVYESPGDGSNPHLHFCFNYSGDDRKFKNSFATLFRKRCTKRINKPIAFSKPKSGQLDILYLCKGPKAISDIQKKDFPGEKVYPEVVYKGIYTDDTISMKHEKWWEDARSLKVGTVKKQDKLPEIEEMIKFVEKKYLGIDGKLNPDFSMDVLEDELIDYYVSKRRLIRFPMLIDYINSIYLIMMSTYQRPKEYLETKISIKYQLQRYRDNKY